MNYHALNMFQTMGMKALHLSMPGLVTVAWHGNVEAEQCTGSMSLKELM